MTAFFCRRASIILAALTLLCALMIALPLPSPCWAAAKQKKHVKHSKQSRKKQAKRKVVKKATVRKATLAQQALTCMVVNPNPFAVMCLSTAGGAYLFRHAGRMVAGAEVWDDRLGPHEQKVFEIVDARDLWRPAKRSAAPFLVTFEAVGLGGDMPIPDRLRRKDFRVVPGGTTSVDFHYRAITRTFANASPDGISPLKVDWAYWLVGNGQHGGNWVRIPSGESRTLQLDGVPPGYEVVYDYDWRDEGTGKQHHGSGQFSDSGTTEIRIPGSSATPSSEGSEDQGSKAQAGDRVDEIKESSHSELPTPQVESSEAADRQTLRFQNGTSYSLRVYVKGPTKRTLELLPGDVSTAA